MSSAISEDRTPKTQRWIHDDQGREMLSLSPSPPLRHLFIVAAHKSSAAAAGTASVAIATSGRTADFAKVKLRNISLWISRLLLLYEATNSWDLPPSTKTSLKVVQYMWLGATIVVLCNNHSVTVVKGCRQLLWLLYNSWSIILLACGLRLNKSNG